MFDETICEVCGIACERCFLSRDGEPICAVCYDAEMIEFSEDIDDTCPDCNGRGRTMEGWPCDDCNGTGRCDL